MPRFCGRPLFNPSTPSPPSSPTQRYLELFGPTPEPESPNRAGAPGKQLRPRVLDCVEILLARDSIVPAAVRDFWRLRKAAFATAKEELAKIDEEEEMDIRSTPRAFGPLEAQDWRAKIKAEAKEDREEVVRSRDARIASFRQEAVSRLHPVDHFLLDLSPLKV
ncbi:hypothetical protein FRC08_009162 [Ceratobasidium sp. 394]|nr:hypothetical protein FRC08_009162 [Ceratobasidium sp. 394]KAG9090005.1 hypothetical protein FS749_000885 [Ceratobasidium sp. UAMH 11750]